MYLTRFYIKLKKKDKLPRRHLRIAQSSIFPSPSNSFWNISKALLFVIKSRQIFKQVKATNTIRSQRFTYLTNGGNQHFPFLVQAAVIRCVGSLLTPGGTCCSDWWRHLLNTIRATRVEPTEGEETLRSFSLFKRIWRL